MPVPVPTPALPERGGSPGGTCRRQVGLYPGPHPADHGGKSPLPAFPPCTPSAAGAAGAEGRLPAPGAPSTGSRSRGTARSAEVPHGSPRVSRHTRTEGGDEGHSKLPVALWGCPRVTATACPECPLGVWGVAVPAWACKGCRWICTYIKYTHFYLTQMHPAGISPPCVFSRAFARSGVDTRGCVGAPAGRLPLAVIWGPGPCLPLRTPQNSHGHIPAAPAPEHDLR